MAKIKTEYGYKSVWSNGIHFITTTKVKDTTLMDQLLLAQMGIKRTTLMESVTEKMVRLMNTQMVLKGITLMENCTEQMVQLLKIQMGLKRIG